MWNPLILQMVLTSVDELVPAPPPPAGHSGKSYWHGIVTVSSDDSVRGAFEKLVKNNILSAPVRSAAHVDEQAVHDHSTYGGFVDMLDLVDFVVRKLHFHENGSDFSFVEEV